MSRLSNGRSLLSQTRSRPAKKQKARNHALSALATAEKINPERTKVRQSRLGEVEDDGPRQRGQGRLVGENGERASKRRKTENLEEDVEGGNTSSDGGSNRWHVGINSSDEDSDLDSDNALGESDEERFQDFAFRGSTTQGSQMHQKKVDLVLNGRNKKTHLIEFDDGEDEDDNVSVSPEGEEEEEEDDDDDDLGEDAVDLATALDLNVEVEEQQREKQKRRYATEEPPMGEDIHNSNTIISKGAREEADEDTSNEEDSESNLALSDDDDEPANTSRLVKFVEGLQKPNGEVLPSRREPSNVPNEPSDFGIKSSRKLTFADLQATVKDANLIRPLKMLHNSEKAGPQAYSGGIPGKLEPPLAKRQQDRLDRSAAYEKSKETLSRWVDTVKQNRRAEHISFPLLDRDALSAPGTKELMPTTESQPLTSLEATIHNIMQESGLASGKQDCIDDRIQALEELQERKMPIEEVQARRAELRKARELMFREEVRARRIKKIKSKSYRRVHRKEREKMAQEEHAALDGAGLLNSDEEREQNDRRRAEERMGARHRESRWAKGVKVSGRATWDEDARAGVADLARRDEELRRRMEGKKITAPGASESEPSSSDSEDDTSSLGSDSVSFRRLQRKLQDLDAAALDNSPGSKLAGMAFMKRAEASRKAANDVEIEQLRQELAAEHSEDAQVAQPPSTGRFKFGSQNEPQLHSKSSKASEAKKAVHNDFEERLSEDEDVAEIQLLTESEDVQFQIEERGVPARPTVQVKKSLRMSKPENAKPKVSGNPWLDGTPKTKKTPIKDQGLIRVEPLADQVSQRTKPEASEKGQQASFVLQDENSSSEGEDEVSRQSLHVQHTVTRNEEMVKMMFAGDNVFEDFAKEKQEAVEEEGDQVIDNTLPGWGNWTGAGISRREQKRAKGRFTTTIKGVQTEERKDAKLDKVIVNEKRVKKNAKYLATELPHPFESKQQYERSLRLPLGPEWTTKTTYQDATKPRVLMKQGIIRPMERPLV